MNPNVLESSRSDRVLHSEDRLQMCLGKLRYNTGSRKWESVDGATSFDNPFAYKPYENAHHVMATENDEHTLSEQTNELKFNFRLPYIAVMECHPRAQFYLKVRTRIPLKVSKQAIIIEITGEEQSQMMA